MCFDIKRFPKIDLHCHLDGSMRSQTLLDLLKEQGQTDIPSLDEIEMRMRVNADCKSLVDYLKRFDLPLLVLQTEEALYQVAKELVFDAAADGVIYLEVRFAPQLHREKGLSLDTIVAAVQRGLADGAALADIDVGLLLCCMRHQTVEQGIEVVEVARRFFGKGIVGIDLAGDEMSFSPLLHHAVFQKAQAYDIPFTIHAGESAGAMSIREALLLGARRIGHGVRLPEDPTLIPYFLQKDIGMELCPTSNLQTKAVLSWENYPLRRFLDEGLAVTINTDNRTVSDITLTKEYALLIEHLGLDRNDFIQMLKNAIHISFAEESVKKRLMEKANEALTDTEML